MIGTFALPGTASHHSSSSSPPRPGPEVNNATMPAASPIGRSTRGTYGHFWTARYAGSPADRQADPLCEPTSKLVILPPTLFTDGTSDRFGNDHLAPDDRGSCKGPPPDCRRIVIRLRSGIKGRSGRRATSTGRRCLVNVHANRPLTPPLQRMDRQQSVRWGRGAAHPRPHPAGEDGQAQARRADDSNDDSNGSDQRQAAAINDGR